MQIELNYWNRDRLCRIVGICASPCVCEISVDVNRKPVYDEVRNIHTLRRYHARHNARVYR